MKIVIRTILAIFYVVILVLLIKGVIKVNNLLKAKQVRDFYYITYDLDGGVGNIQNEKIISGDKSQRPENNPTKTGYVFTGWYKNVEDDDEYLFNEEIKEDTTLYAKYLRDDNLKTITIKFDTKTDEQIDDIKIKQGQSIILPIPSKNRSDFKGWSDGKETIKSTTKLKNDVTLAAIVNEEGLIYTVTKDGVNVYVVNFNTRGGYLIKSQWIEEGKTVKKPDDAIRDGYKFTGWYVNDIPYDFNSPVVHNLTIDAQWEEETK